MTKLGLTNNTPALYAELGGIAIPQLSKNKKFMWREV